MAERGCGECSLQRADTEGLAGMDRRSNRQAQVGGCVEAQPCVDLFSSAEGQIGRKADLYQPFLHGRAGRVKFLGSAVQQWRLGIFEQGSGLLPQQVRVVGGVRCNCQDLTAFSIKQNDRP